MRGLSMPWAYGSEWIVMAQMENTQQQPALVTLDQKEAGAKWGGDQQKVKNAGQSDAKQIVGGNVKNMYLYFFQAF